MAIFLLRMCPIGVVLALAAIGQAQVGLLQTNLSDVLIDLGYAKYKGTFNFSTGIKTWYGIRYAAPPIGELRWRPPMNTEEISYIQEKELIDATKQGPICIQSTPGWRKQQPPRATNLIMSEDCLLLDVSVPAIPKNATSLPVLVQIHGGGYATGDSQSYPGDTLISHSEGSLIYVSIQYRLGPYGFLSSNALKTDGAANVGFLDQRAALEWVQHHISVFGGDPERVTITGGSAGGGSVTAQMMLYGGTPGLENPPFRSAIAEYPFWQSYHDDSFVEAQYEQLLQLVGCLDLPCLRNVSGSTLQSAAKQTYVAAYEADSRSRYGFGDFYWGPSVDGDIIRELPSQAFKRGAFSFVSLTPLIRAVSEAKFANVIVLEQVPLLTNHATFEGYSFSNQSVTIQTERADLRHLFPRATDVFLDRIFKLYATENFNSTFWHRQAVFSDAVINCPTQWIADGVEVLGKPVYKMVFGAGTQLHGATKPFLFGPGYTWSGYNYTLARFLRDWYVSFVIHQDPNKESFSGSLSDDKPVWAPYSSTKPPKAVLNVEAEGISTIFDPDYNDKCSFWRSQSDISRN